MTDQIGTIQAELTQLRTQAQDLSDRAAESWQAMQTLRASGTPQGVTDAAVQQIVNQHYQQESAKLDQRRRRLEEQLNTMADERKGYSKARAESIKYLEQNRERYELFCKAEAIAAQISALDPNCFELRQAQRFCVSEFSSTLSAYRRVEADVREYDARLAQLGA